jgi:hypothetical protein
MQVLNPWNDGGRRQAKKRARPAAAELTADATTAARALSLFTIAPPGSARSGIDAFLEWPHTSTHEALKRRWRP